MSALLPPVGLRTALLRLPLPPGPGPALAPPQGRAAPPPGGPAPAGPGPALHPGLHIAFSGPAPGGAVAGPEGFGRGRPDDAAPQAPAAAPGGEARPGPPPSPAALASPFPALPAPLLPAPPLQTPAHAPAVAAPRHPVARRRAGRGGAGGMAAAVPRGRLRAAAAGLLIAALLLAALLVLPRPGRGMEVPVPDPGPAARAATAAICDRVAAEAARETGVPLDVLRAITRTETGRKLDGRFQPWPWTINREGKGLWFDSQAEAIAYAEQSLREGSTSFDTACFQINYRWHGKEFETLAAMFDPLTNARYAARFLSQLHAEHGDWSKAAGSYHSRTEEYATRYAARFDRIRAGLGAMEDEVLTAALPPPPLPHAPASFTPLTLPRTPGGVVLSQRLVAGGLLLRAAAPVSLLTPARPLFD